jgi:hypothetical protein
VAAADLAEDLAPLLTGDDPHSYYLADQFAEYLARRHQCLPGAVRRQMVRLVSEGAAALVDDGAVWCAKELCPDWLPLKAKASALLGSGDSARAKSMPVVTPVIRPRDALQTTRDVTEPSAIAALPPPRFAGTRRHRPSPATPMAPISPRSSVPLPATVEVSQLHRRWPPRLHRNDSSGVASNLHQALVSCPANID